MDSRGKSFWYLLLVDDATDYCSIGMVGGHDSGNLWAAYEDGWLRWAGPPDRFVTDNERGLISKAVVDLFARSGTFFDPAAPKAPTGFLARVQIAKLFGHMMSLSLVAPFSAKRLHTSCHCLY